jgi:4-carboxymuconolactone decarboxylase
MTRIPRLRPDEMTEEQRALYDTITTGPRGTTLLEPDGCLKGPFNAFLLSPQTGHALQELGAALRYRSSLSPRVREMATLLVAVRWRSDYEWQAHERLARAAGVSDGELESLQAGAAPQLEDLDEREAVQLVRGLLDGGVSDRAWRSAADRLGRTAVFELATLVGYYGTLALQLRLFGVDARDPRDQPG